jgi:hypothetical protein
MAPNLIPNMAQIKGNALESLTEGQIVCFWAAAFTIEVSLIFVLMVVGTFTAIGYGRLPHLLSKPPSLYS